MSFCLIVASLSTLFGCRSVEDWAIHTSRTRVQSYFQGHEAGWTSLAEDLKRQGLTSGGRYATLDRGCLNSVLGSTDASQHLTDDFAVSMTAASTEDLFAITLTRRTEDTDRYEHWVIYYIVNEAGNGSIAIRAKAATRAQAGQFRWSGYCWTFGDHWIGERVQ